MHALRTFSKHLVWMAVMLSPFQTLHGTVFRCCTSLKMEEPAVCHRDHRCLHDHSFERTIPCESVYERQALTTISDTHASIPHSPCPPDCGCRRTPPTQPLPNSSHPFESLLLLAQAELNDAFEAQTTPGRIYQHGPTIPRSAQQTCSFLCRFVA